MTRWKIPPPILRQVGWRYGLAVGSVGVALGAALLFGRGFDIRGALFLTAIAITAWFGGMLPGLTALLLSVVSLGYFFQPLVPYVELAGIRVPYRVLSLTFFTSLGLTVCWLSASRRRAEEALRESEQRWRNLTEALPQLVWGAGRDGGCDYFSTQWTTYTGIPESKLLGWAWMEALHSDDREPTRQFWTESVAGRQPYDVEYRIRRTDGTYGWFKTRGTPIRDTEGRIVKWFGTCTDISDRKRAEQELRERELELRQARDLLEIKVMERTKELRRNEAYLAEAQKLSKTGSFGWNVFGGEIYWSEETFRIFEYGPATRPRLQLVLERTHPEDRVRVQQAIDRASQDAKNFDIEHRLLMSDGSVKHVHVVGHLLETGQPGKTELVGAITDITERKRAEVALRQTEEYLEDAQRLSHTGSWARVPDTGAMRYWSAECYRVLGFEPLGGPPPFETFLQHVHPDDRAKVRAAAENATRAKVDYELDYRIVHPGGNIRDIHTIAHPVLSPSRDVVEFVGTVMDVTERRQAEKERERLRQVQADLAHISRATTMGELTASLAHEINQPITAAATDARTCLRWLAREQPDIGEARESAARMVNAVTRAADIISRLRQLFKKGAPQTSLVDVSEVIQEMVVLLRSEASRHSVSIVTELSEDLPRVVADRVQLQQVLMNLMLNGIEAMQDTSGGQLTIRSLRGEGGQLLISVSDTGTGLPPDQADQIFNAFFSTKAQGTGMGLSISRSIIESHGGRLWATSNSGRGATFNFTLPSAEAQE
ncbi:MAG: PAS domain-containing protein [Candidatus Sulfotelmatobacter sp.]|jgi:PAS domain S-box-containing protein